MTRVKGMLVRLKTAPGGFSGTDDHLYVGVVGTHGGREFPLDVENFNDWEPGTDIKYWFGDVWEGASLSGAKNPYKAHTWNDPEKWRIELEKVNQIYLRKGGSRQGKDDNAYKLDRIEVTIYGDSPNKRTFKRGTDIILANEYGLQVWIPEV